MKILRPTPQDYDELLTVWEASVRSTHHFLTEENIQFYKPLVRNQYFQAVELYIIRNREGKIAAFMGLSDELIEMLFVHPDEQGKGYGKQLMHASVNIIIALVLNMIWVYFVVSMTGRVERFLGKGGIYIIRKFFGIILLAISVRLFMANISLLLESFHN